LPEDFCFYEEIDVNAIGEKVKNAGVVAKDVSSEQEW